MSLGTLLGVVICIPAVWFGALNITPFKPITYPLARLMMTLRRSIHEIVWALFFVAVVGLGALAGIFAIAVRSVGFIAKMSAEAIEDIDPGPVEAIRAVGGNGFQVLLYAILPQVLGVIDRDYMSYVVETIQMAYLGALFGLLMAIPLGWFGSFNMTPSRRFIYPLARLITMAFRAVHEMIWAILFVSILGFGMLAGVLALTFFCAGFAGKLFAEEIEAIDMGPVEAMRATGANLFQIMVFGVFPQVRVAFTGIGIYTWDVAFRAATVVGFVGAGGMG